MANSQTKLFLDSHADPSRRSEVKFCIIGNEFSFATNSCNFCSNRAQLDAVSEDCPSTFDQDALNLQWVLSLPSNLTKVISLTLLQFFDR